VTFPGIDVRVPSKNPQSAQTAKLSSNSIQMSSVELTSLGHDSFYA